MCLILILILFNLVSNKTVIVNAQPYLGCSYDSKLQADSTYVQEAQKSMRDTGVFASLTLAQAIQEQSLKAPSNNNMFGIKMTGTYKTKQQCEGAGGSWKSTHEEVDGKSVSINACFKKYSSPAGSFEDHGKWLIETLCRLFQQSILVQ